MNNNKNHQVSMNNPLNQFYGPLDIDDQVIFYPPCIIGMSIDEIKGRKTSFRKETKICNGTIIKPYALIGQGAQIGHNVEIHEYSKVGDNTTIGDGTKLIYGVKIYKNVSIGAKSIIAGFVCNGAKIGNRTTMMGQLVHRYPSHAIDSWDDSDPEELPAPIIDDDVIIGFNAIIIGGVTIGHNSYVGAGLVVRSDVPPNTIILTSKPYGGDVQCILRRR